MDQLLLSTSGGFATGPGRYSVEVVLTDQRGHTCRKQVELKTGEIKHRTYDFPALAPDAVEPLIEPRWNGKLATDGLRLTILLRAEGSGLAKGQTYLLESLAELLAALPCRSVKVIAFNLDRQQEIFRQSSLDGNGFVELKESMERQEYVTIPYNSLARGAWRTFLLDMAQKEAGSVEQPDVIVLLGSWRSNGWDKLPMDAIRRLEPSNTQFFYLEYYPRFGGPPDPLEKLTKGLHGAVFQVWSPKMFEVAIRKMLVQIHRPSK